VPREGTRLRADLTRERTLHWQRLEKLLEDALIKVTSVAPRIGTMPVRDMIEAMIGGQRDPVRLASLARGRMKAKHNALVTLGPQGGIRSSPTARSRQTARGRRGR
jgi:transposase